MSLVFLKSQDKQNKPGEYNPNTPSRFSNYLTQPIRLPPDSQVSYVSSQYSLGNTLSFDNQPSYINTEKEENVVLNAPVQMLYNIQGQQVGGVYSQVNGYVLSANEFGMDGDYTGLKYENENIDGAEQLVSSHGIRQTFNKTTEKCSLLVTPRLAIDQYNLYFNCMGKNPAFLSSSWNGDPGSSVPAGFNYTTTTDQKFYNDIKVTIHPSPEGLDTARDTVCAGYDIGEATTDANKTTQIYNAGANFYNTGFTSNGITSGGFYNWLSNASADIPLPEFNAGAYAGIYSTAGIKKSIGNFTPSVASNRGGHVTPGGMEIVSGGYGIQGFSNTNKTQADVHYDDSSTDRRGYCGIAPFFAGVNSIPLIQQLGRDLAKDQGVAPELYNTWETQSEWYNKANDLNDSLKEDEPVGGVARYLFGIYGRDEFENGNSNDVRFKIRSECLVPCGLKDTLPGTPNAGLFDNRNAADSRYIDVGRTLDVYQLSKGINTATDDGVPYTFDPNANYSFNVYNDGVRESASLFFRYRWINKNQMDIEFTISEENNVFSYDSAKDEPYEPPGFIAPAPSVPSTPVQDILLDNTTNGTTVNITSNTRFRDSGADGNYNPNESYDITFVAPAGTFASFTITDFEFEHSTFAMYDRLGIQSSTDGVTWTNVSFAGFNSSANVTAPWSTSYGSPQTPGWIFPDSTNDLAGVGNLNDTFNVGAQYVRFTFVSDGSAQRRGWDLQMNAIPSAAVPNKNDPRDKWVTLSSMNFGTKKFMIPSYMGDIGMVYYPIAGSNDFEPFRSLQKGWFDIRQTNRYWLENNNGGGLQYAPFTYDNKGYDFDYLGTLSYDFGLTNIGPGQDASNSEDQSQTSGSLIVSTKFKGFPTTFVTDDTAEKGVLSVEKMFYLGIPTKSNSETEFLNMEGYTLFKVNLPETEVGYIFGYNDDGNRIAVRDIPRELVPNQNKLTGGNKAQSGTASFTNHIQLSNLPLISQNGVVSSVAKTIYVSNTLGQISTQDSGDFRYFNDRTPYPIWIDLNNLETIELNRLDVLITNDDNREQTALSGDTEVVVVFRQKEKGILPNAIPNNSTSMTRTY